MIEKEDQRVPWWSWLGLGAFTNVGTGSILGWGTKIPQTA